MTPPPPPPPKKKKIATKCSYLKKYSFWWKPPKNIEIQKFNPQKMDQAYVCMKISECPPPPPPPPGEKQINQRIRTVRSTFVICCLQPFLATSCARIQKVLSEGVQLWQCFFFHFFIWWGEGGSIYHYKRTIIGPPAKYHSNGVLLKCRWWRNTEFWLGSRSLWFFLYFCDFSGGGGLWIRPAPPPPLWIRACTLAESNLFVIFSRNGYSV